MGTGLLATAGLAGLGALGATPSGAVVCAGTTSQADGAGNSCVGVGTGASAAGGDYQSTNTISLSVSGSLSPPGTCLGKS